MASADILPSENFRNVVAFIENEMIGKSVTTSDEVTALIECDRGSYRSVGRQITSFVNFSRTSRGFAFDMVRDIRQTLFDIDAQKQSVGNGECVSRTSVIRYQASEHPCAPGIVRGFSQSISSNCGATQGDLQDGTGFCRNVRFRFDRDRMHVDEDTVDFTYLYAGPGRWKPGAVTVHSEYYVQKGTLHQAQRGSSYDVDVNTGRRSHVETEELVYLETSLARWATI
jgi:hypothetical protein